MSAGLDYTFKRINIYDGDMLYNCILIDGPERLREWKKRMFIPIDWIIPTFITVEYTTDGLYFNYKVIRREMFYQELDFNNIEFLFVYEDIYNKLAYAYFAIKDVKVDYLCCFRVVQSMESNRPFWIPCNFPFKPTHYLNMFNDLIDAREMHFRTSILFHPKLELYDSDSEID